MCIKRCSVVLNEGCYYYFFWGVYRLQKINSDYLDGLRFIGIFRSVWRMLFRVKSISQGADIRNVTARVYSTEFSWFICKMCCADPQLTENKETLKVVPSNGCKREKLLLPNCFFWLVFLQRWRCCFYHGLCGFVNAFFSPFFFVFISHKMPYCTFNMYILYIKLK